MSAPDNELPDIPTAAWCACHGALDGLPNATHTPVSCGAGGPVADAAASFVCPRCWARSSHPTDAAEGYCGRCHDWTRAPSLLQRAAAIHAAGHGDAADLLAIVLAADQLLDGHRGTPRRCARGPSKTGNSSTR